MHLLKFYADWCQPCKQQTKILESMELTVPLTEIDIDKDRASAIEYGIRAVPTMLLVDENQNILSRMNGVHIKQQIENIINQHKKSKTEN